MLGRLALSRVDGEVLDSFYAEVRRCRKRCDGRRGNVDHRTAREHECDERCRPHVCKPLAAATVRQIHWILSGAFDRAVRWNWVSVSPVGLGGAAGASEAGLGAADGGRGREDRDGGVQGPDWGAFVWTAITTGARRGELCALRRSDRQSGVLRIPRSVGGRRTNPAGEGHEDPPAPPRATRQREQRVLDELIERQDARAAELGLTIAEDAYLFSLDPDCGRPPVPDSVSQRYDRMVTKLGIQTTLHRLRHYNATELLAAGADLRTVAGRLGHAGGGATTLRVYAAYVDEASTKAAESLANRMPRRPRASGNR